MTIFVDSVFWWLKGVVCWGDRNWLSYLMYVNKDTIHYAELFSSKVEEIK